MELSTAFICDFHGFWADPRRFSGIMPDFDYLDILIFNTESFLFLCGCGFPAIYAIDCMVGIDVA